MFKLTETLSWSHSAHVYLGFTVLTKVCNAVLAMVNEKCRNIFQISLEELLHYQWELL